MLLKVALILGCEFIENVTFEEICPKNVVGLCNKENDDPRVTSSTNGTHPATPKRKCSVPTDLPTNGEVDDVDGNICGIASKLASDSDINFADDDDDIIPGNGIVCSESDSEETSSDTEVEKFEEQEELKERQASNQQYISDGHSRCACCCHLHAGNLWDSSNSTDEHYSGAMAHFSITSSNPATASHLVDYDFLVKKLHTYQFDVLLGADGRRNTLCENFPRKEFRGKLAIAITANFVNNHTVKEAQVPEISGLSFIYHQQLFK